MADSLAEITKYVESLPAWQADNLMIFRRLVCEVYPTVEEDWKWSVPVFVADGNLICSMAGFKDHTKFNFFEGASLHDTQKIFNSGLDSKKHRSINLAKSDAVPVDALKDLVAQAIRYANLGK